jgi:lysophospholipase L1-like esterase
MRTFARAFLGTWTALALLGAGRAHADDARWVGTWSCSPQLADEAQATTGAGFKDTTLRQVVHVSIGGTRLRVRFSNAFGTTPLALASVRLARSAGGSAIDPASERGLTFGGRESVTVPAGAPIVSDPIDFDLPALSEVAVTAYLERGPDAVTIHPGSRTTSYLQSGRAVSARELPDARRVDHWFFLAGLDVVAPNAAAVVILGDSITDGRGSTTNGNDRWPDELARRLHARRGAPPVGVLNAGIGGNRLLRDGLGPSALARLDRDVLAQPGAAWLIVLEGVNDLGTRVSARAKGETWATAEDVIAAYEQIVRRAHARGLRVYGGTITPLEGFEAYSTPDVEADRQAVNRWIRTSGVFDGVIDFDAAVRDRDKPSRLAPVADVGDHLHPGVQGHRMLAGAVDLGLFDRRPSFP